MTQHALLMGAFILALTACAAERPGNPSFPLSVAEARKELRAMEKTPPAEASPRPVVVLGGFMDPGILPARVARKLRKLTGQREIMAVNFAFCGDFDDCRERLLNAVQDAWPCDDPEQTIEVDVVAISMGGLVARHAGSGHDDRGRRLRIARLFTIGTPHRGAAMASLPTLDHCQIAMRPRSEFLEQLNGGLNDPNFPIFAYVRLDDAIVGAENAAPPGRSPWWVPNRPLELAHINAPSDPRILADIARRLRGEAAYATDPPAELPR